MMKHFPFAVLLSLALCAAPPSARAQVSVEVWSADMMVQLPGFFCQPDQYFMQCFDVDEAECRTVSAQEAQRCAEDLADQLPDVLNMPEDGRQWGTELGRCAGIGYDRVLADRKSDAPRCNPRG